MPELEDAARERASAFPFILVDKVLAKVPGERAIGLRNVTANDPLISVGGAGGGRGAGGLRRGLMIEAFSQLSAAALAPEGAEPRAVEISRIDSMRFLRTPVPGDQLVLTVELSKELSGAEEGEVRVFCKAEVDGALVAEGTVVVLC